MPRFKAFAADNFCKVGEAFAAADEASLRQLTTASCFRTLQSSLQSRPAGQSHRWRSFGVDARIKQVRLGHHASDHEVRFAQVTCEILARIVWELHDSNGEVIGKTGSDGDPFRVNDFWVFERNISVGAKQPDSPQTWLLKERLKQPATSKK